MELSHDAALAILERWPTATLTTVTEQGRPHAVPIVFARSQGSLWSPIDGKPKRGGELARVRHIRHEPRVSLLFANYDDDWSRLWWLRADGKAEIRNAANRRRGADELKAALAALRHKYPQYERIALLGPDAQLLRITIANQRSWCASAAAAAAIETPIAR